MEKNCANALIVYEMFIVCSYLSGSIRIVRKNVTKDAVMVCICIITHTIFFIIIAPVSHYRGTPRFWAFFGLFFLWVGMDGGRDGRTAGGAAAWSCALERNKEDALQRNSGIVLSPSCALERNKEGIKVVINGLI